MKLSISTMTANRRFVKALRRQQGTVDELKRRLESVAVDNCPHDILLLAFVDNEADYFKVIPGDADVFEVEVGYDSNNDFQPDDDVLLIQLLEEKLTLMVSACEQLGGAKGTILGLIEDWTTDAITP